MAAKKIILWRHGQTEYNRLGRMQGQIDIELNETGLAQARLAAEQIAKLEPAVIVSSPLQRAWQTAQALSQYWAKDIIADERLLERAFGGLEGLDHKQMSGPPYAQWYRQWRETGECLEAGIEDRGAVGARMKSAIEQWCQRIDPGQTLVMVSHGSAHTQGLIALLGLDPVLWQGLRGLDNCHWSVVIEYGQAPFWRLHSHNLGVVGAPGGQVQSRA